MYVVMLLVHQILVLPGLSTTNAYQQCLSGGQALIVFEWETECDIQSVLYSNAEGAGPFEYPVGIDATNFGVYAGNGQMPPNWEVEHYLEVKFTDGTLSDPIPFTPDPLYRRMYRSKLGII